MIDIEPCEIWAFYYVRLLATVNFFTPQRLPVFLEVIPAFCDISSGLVFLRLSPEAEG